MTFCYYKSASAQGAEMREGALVPIRRLKEKFPRRFCNSTLVQRKNMLTIATGLVSPTLSTTDHGFASGYGSRTGSA